MRQTAEEEERLRTENAALRDELADLQTYSEHLDVMSQSVQARYDVLRSAEVEHRVEWKLAQLKEELEEAVTDRALPDQMDLIFRAEKKLREQLLAERGEREALVGADDDGRGERHAAAAHDERAGRDVDARALGSVQEWTHADCDADGRGARHGGVITTAGLSPRGLRVVACRRRRGSVI